MQLCGLRLHEPHPCLWSEYGLPGTPVPVVWPGAEKGDTPGLTLWHPWINGLLLPSWTIFNMGFQIFILPSVSQIRSPALCVPPIILLQLMWCFGCILWSQNPLCGLRFSLPWLAISSILSLSPCFRLRPFTSEMTSSQVLFWLVWPSFISGQP